MVLAFLEIDSGTTGHVSPLVSGNAYISVRKVFFSVSNAELGSREETAKLKI